MSDRRMYPMRPDEAEVLIRELDTRIAELEAERDGLLAEIEDYVQQHNDDLERIDRPDDVVIFDGNRLRVDDVWPVAIKGGVGVRFEATLVPVEDPE